MHWDVIKPYIAQGREAPECYIGNGAQHDGHSVRPSIHNEHDFMER